MDGRRKEEEEEKGKSLWRCCAFVALLFVVETGGPFELKKVAEVKCSEDTGVLELCRMEKT